MKYSLAHILSDILGENHKNYLVWSYVWVCWCREIFSVPARRVKTT